MSLAYDPADPETCRNPYPVLARLRAEDPVHWSPVLKAWVVTRYDDVRHVLAGDELSPDRLTPFYTSMPAATRSTLAEAMRYLNLWVVFRDPPAHTRLRRLMNQAFAHRSIQARRPDIEAIVDRLISSMKGEGRADLVASFTMPLPALVIMRLLGVPSTMLLDVKRWSDDMMLFIGSARGTADKYERARNGAMGMATLFRALIAERRSTPQDDIPSELIVARDGGDSLTEDELVATAMLFLFAGHETTTNLLGNAVVALMANPGELERLRSEPDIAGSAIEEFLRFDGPSNAMGRVVRRAHRLGDRDLTEGDRVFAMINAANRDETQFAAPDRLDLGRTPNRHLAFGQGIHFCLGAPLARLEAQVAIPRLIEAFPALAPDGGPEWLGALVMRGPRRLPVRLGR